MSNISIKKRFGFMAAVVLIAALLVPFGARAAQGAVTVELSYTDSINGFAPLRHQLEVAPDISERYNMADDFDGEAPTALDAIVSAFYEMNGDELTDFVRFEGGMVYLADVGYNFVYFVNGEPANVGAGSCELKDGDSIALYAVNDKTTWTDSYAWFEQGGKAVQSAAVGAGEALSLSIIGRWNVLLGETAGDYAPAPLSGISIVLLTPQSGANIAAFGDVLRVTDDSGVVKLDFNEPGEYIIAAIGDDGHGVNIMAPMMTISVTPATVETAEISNPATGDSNTLAVAALIGAFAAGIAIAIGRKKSAYNPR